MSCGSRDGERDQVLLDLVRALPTATANREPETIDLGTAAARPYLHSGWSWNETDAGGMDFVWSSGSSSVLEFYLVEPRAMGVVLRCFPYLFPGAPQQRVEVEANGREVAEVVLSQELEEYEVHLPQDAVRAGRNHLLFRYHYARSPREVLGTKDGRRLAVGWDAIRFEAESTGRRETTRAGGEPRGPGVEVRDGHLWIPFGSQVDYYFELLPGSELSFQRLEVTGQGRLDLAIQWDEAPERKLDRVGRRDRQTRQELEAPAGPVRLSLRAVPDAPRRPSSTPPAPRGAVRGVVLEAPQVRGPRLDSAPEPGSPHGPRDPATVRAFAPPTHRPHVIVYLVDTLRADHLGCYGYDRPITPNIDAFAAEGILFEDANAQSSWTKTSVASLFTGLGPLAHGVNDPRHRLPEEMVTLAEYLKGLGYQTAGFSTNDNVKDESGFAQGFDHFELLTGLSDEVNRRVFAWLDESAGPGPLFLYIHTIDPHAPYEPAAEYRRRFAASVRDPEVGSVHAIQAMGDKKIEVTDELLEDLIALYDAEIAYNDEHFGQLRRGLRERQLEDNAVVVFLSDHGEEFDEHGVLGHGWDLYQEVLGVPLIVRLPGGPRGLRISEPVQHIDLLPTLLDLVGLAVPPELPGAALLSPGRESRGSHSRSVLAYMDYDGRAGASLVKGDWKLIEPLVPTFASGSELYFRPLDRREKDDLAARHPILTGYLSTLVRQEVLAAEKTPEPPQAQLSEETERRLRALGYLQ